MLAFGHRTHNVGEDLDFSLFGRDERLGLEEWDHPVQQVNAASDDEHQRGVPRPCVVGLDPTAAKPSLQCVEDAPALRRLADVELWNELPSDPRASVALQRNVERALAVNETGEIRIQPFLLIDRT